MSPKILILLINLDVREDRLKKMKARLKAFDFMRVSAVSINDLPEQISKTKSRLALSEIACARSHISALKRFLESKYETCVILEDDIVLGNYFFDFISKFQSMPDNAFVIKLETHLNKFYQSRFPIILEEFKFNVIHTFHYGAAAYAVSRKGARLIINELGKFDFPVDDVIFDRMVSSNNFGLALQLNPACCIQEKHIFEGMKGDSDIEADRLHNIRKLSKDELVDNSARKFWAKSLINFLKKVLREIMREIFKVYYFIKLKVRKRIKFKE